MRLYRPPRAVVLLLWLGCVLRMLWHSHRTAVEMPVDTAALRHRFDVRSSRQPGRIPHCLQIDHPADFSYKWIIRITKPRLVTTLHDMETITNTATNLWKACVLLFSKRVFYFLGAFPPVCCSPGCCTGSSYSWGTILCQKCWCRCTSTLCFACPREAGSRWTSELTSHGHISQFEWYLKIHKQSFLFTAPAAE